MKERLTGSEGANETLRSSVRLLVAIFVCSLMCCGVSAQANLTATGVHNGLNQDVQLEGQLEITYQDMKDGHHRLLYSLRQSDGTRVSLQFTKEPPTHFLSGDHVRAKGQRSGGSLVLYSGSTSLTTSSTSGDATGTPSASIPVPYTFGTQSTLVILVNFQDLATQPYSPADVYNAVFGTANSFLMENSYGQISLSGDVVGWFTIPLSVTTCDTSQLATAAQNAAVAAGVNLSSYTRYMYAFPQNNACGFGGASFVGGNPSQSWINGDTLDIHIIDHELGHALGLWHSHALDCGASATICSNGNVVEYGDALDVLGVLQTPSPHYNSFQKERLGWLNYGTSPSIQTVQASGTYTINPYETGGAGPNALKILKSTDPTTGARSWYYLEARQSMGFDTFLTDGTCTYCYTQNETNGVLFHIGTDGNGSSGDLLDMTPATPTSGFWYDMSLAVGQTFQDSATGVTITTTAVDSAGAMVQITLSGSGASSCTPSNPTVTVSPAQSQSVTSGTAVSFTVTVADKDGSSCAPATFNLASALPPGWTGTWSAPALSLSPGKTGSSTLTVTSPVGTADGSYTVDVNATNSSPGYAGSAVAQYVINAAPLTIGLATDQSNYIPGQTVTITVTMLYGAAPDAGASVTATVTTPNGRAATLSGTTGSNGVVLLGYKLSNNASTGTYVVQAQAGTAKSGGGGRTKGGATPSGASAVAEASTSFTVR